MEVNMEQLLEKVFLSSINLCMPYLLFPIYFRKLFLFYLLQIMSVQSRSDGVNTSLFEKREHIEKLHRTRNLLRKVQVSLKILKFANTVMLIFFCWRKLNIFFVGTAVHLWSSGSTWKMHHQSKSICRCSAVLDRSEAYFWGLWRFILPRLQESIWGGNGHSYSESSGKAFLGFWTYWGKSRSRCVSQADELPWGQLEGRQDCLKSRGLPR